jgi:hypothetical protein
MAARKKKQNVIDKREKRRSRESTREKRLDETKIFRKYC